MRHVHRKSERHATPDPRHGRASSPPDGLPTDWNGEQSASDPNRTSACRFEAFICREPSRLGVVLIRGRDLNGRFHLFDLLKVSFQIALDLRR